MGRKINMKQVPKTKSARNKFNEQNQFDEEKGFMRVKSTVKIKKKKLILRPKDTSKVLNFYAAFKYIS